MEVVSHPVTYEPFNLGPEINSVSDEYWPSLTVDGNTLIFTRLIPMPGSADSFQEDFFMSRKVSDGWTKAEPVVSINSLLNEGAQTISAGGNLLFFTLCNHSDGFGSCDIWFSRFADSVWTAPRNAGPILNTPSWESQPSVSTTGDMLYFSSNRPGGKGNKDIWRVRIKSWRPDGLPVWDTPVNLGDSINTSGDEISPFIHHDGKTLFFSSDKWPGLGGFDLFRSRLNNDGTWEKAANMGYPLNSHRNEQGLVIDRTGITAYLASNREAGNGMDIFSFELDERLRPEPVTFVQGIVTDRKTGAAVSARVRLTGIEADRKFETELTADKNGNFMVTLPSGQEFAFHVNHPGYLFYSEHFFVEPSGNSPDPIIRSISLIPVEVGSQTHLYNIFFQTGSYEILPQSWPELESLAGFLDKNQDLLIEVQGHTDNVGSESFNQVLSEKRAGSVMDYLIEHGIHAERLSAKGYGFSSPVESNDTEEGRSKNRRTTILVTGISQPLRP
jgi:outer membrane protein OmpA-like peptidoglycan-associated protein